jgi:hypothetical protein
MKTVKMMGMILLLLLSTFAAASAQENGTTSTEPVQNETEPSLDKVVKEELEPLEEVEAEEAEEAEPVVEEPEDLEEEDLTANASQARAAELKKLRTIKIDKKALEVEGRRSRALGVLYDLQRHSAGMQAVIDLAQEKGLDTSELVALKEKFDAVVSEVEKFLSDGGEGNLGQLVSEARRIANDFRKEARALLADHLDEAQRRVANETSADRPELRERLAEHYAHRLRHLLKNYVHHVVRAQKLIHRLEKTGADVTEAQAKLDEIKAQKEPLIQAIKATVAACREQGVPYAECDAPEKERLGEMLAGLKEDFHELNEILRETKKGLKERAMVQAFHRIRATVAHLEERLRKAEEEGVDVAVYLAQLAEVNRLLDSAEEKAKNGDIKGAKEDLRAAHKALKEILKDLKKERKELLRDLKRDRAKRLELIKKQATERKDVLRALQEKRKEELKRLREEAREKREALRKEAEERREALRDRAEERKETLRDLAEERKETLRGLAEETRDAMRTEAEQ